MKPYTMMRPVNNTQLFKLLVGYFFLCFNLTSAKAQSQLEWLLKHPDFKPIITDHLLECRKTTAPNVSIILFKPDADTLKVYLTAITYLVEAQQHLPASFTIVEGQKFLIYDGSELLIENKEQWFSKVRTFVGKSLCDDLEHREILKKQIPGESRSPCGYIYEPFIHRYTFLDGRLVKHKLVGAVPYYLVSHD